jgi:hypothetical protein
MTDTITKTRRWTRRPEGSNWGEFGEDDQVGRLNLITPAMRKAAAAEIKEGLCFVLSLPLDYPGGEAPDAYRQRPRLFAREIDGAPLYNRPFGRLVGCDDNVVMTLQYSTQWDSLAHVGAYFDVDGSGEKIPVYYNGWRAHEHIVGPKGDEPPCAHALGIENMAMTGVSGRGVLFDFVRAFGTGRTLVGHDQLMRVIEDQKIDVRKGDFLLFYTGYGDALMAMNKQPDQAVLERTGAALDGADKRLLQWIDEVGAVSLISDNPAVEYMDPTLDPNVHDVLPLHEHCLFKLGIHLGELFWLSDLAHYLRGAGRSAFQFTGPPLRLPGAVGSPATPVAVV